MQTTDDGPFRMLRLDEGERLPEALALWARAEGVRAAAVVSGIGLVRDTELGYLRNGRYEPGSFPEPMELLALGGSIAEVDGAPSVHLHLTGGRSDHSAVGGHLLRSTVALLVEIGVQTFPGRRFGRPEIPGSNLRRLELAPPARD
jgi:hypothetical protein